MDMAAVADLKQKFEKAKNQATRLEVCETRKMHYVAACKMAQGDYKQGTRTAKQRPIVGHCSVHSTQVHGRAVECKFECHVPGRAN